MSHPRISRFFSNSQLSTNGCLVVGRMGLFAQQLHSFTMACWNVMTNPGQSMTGRLLREMLLGCATCSAIIGTQHRQIHLSINWHITNARSYTQASAININELAAMTIKLHVGGAGILTSCAVCCCIWPHFKALMITKTVRCKIRMAHQAWQDTIIFLAYQISHCHKISCTN